MKNFKQVLALAVVFCVMLSTVAFAVPTDVVGTKYESAATRLGALGIMIGDTDGNFNPEKVVTRAEMAKIVVYMVGSAAAAESAKDSSKFSDVGTHWASGFISVAASLGIVNGMGDNKFAPDAEVTYAQAVTMVVRAMGYETAAKDKGGYPTGYLVVATQYEVTDGVDGSLNKGVVRGAIAQMVDNALDKPLMVQVTYSSGGDKEYVESGTQGTAEQTILTDKLKLDAYKGTVSAFDAEKNKVTFKSVTKREIKNSVVQYNSTSLGQVSYAKGLTFTADVKEMQVEFWVNDDDVVVAYTYPDDVEIVFGNIKTINGASSTALKAKMYKVAGTASSTVEIAEDFLFSNGVEYAIDADEITLYDMEADEEFIPDDNNDMAASVDLALYTEKLAKLVIIDGVVEKICFMNFTTKGIVTEVKDAYIKYSEDGVKSASIIANLDIAENVSVLLNGVVSSLTAIKPGMYIEFNSYTEDNADEDSYYIAATDASVKGKLAQTKNTSSFFVDTKEVKASMPTVKAGTMEYYVSSN
ncbi:MAG: S-layer homology domain-containing protein, partial [Hyphomonadaceae bacterium]|nr:S-layer homology domain-containing protein [Clostridia bacterium]